MVININKEIHKEFSCRYMKLKHVLSIMCPSNTLSNTILTPLYTTHRTRTDEHSQNVIFISFEYAYQTQEPKRKKKKQKTKANAQHDTSINEHINKTNPIFDILHRNNNTNTSSQHISSNTAVKSVNSTNHEKTTMPTTVITQRVWNMKAIAPLILWLQKQHKRFVHSDWVNHYSNGERELIVSQHGTVISKEHIEDKHHYSCMGGFHNIHLRCSVHQVSHYTQENEVEIWSSFIRKKNVYCKTYQQRIYVWIILQLYICIQWMENNIMYLFNITIPRKMNKRI